MTPFPGSPAQNSLAAYYVSEAVRIESLAAGAGLGRGRECFEEVAREYRALASALEDDDAEEAVELSPPTTR